MKKNKLIIICGVVLLLTGLIFILNKTSNKQETNTMGQSLEFEYETIKTKDVEEKTLLSFPIYRNVKPENITDYVKYYSSEKNDISVYATVIESDESIDNIINAQITNIKNEQEEENFKENEFNFKNKNLDKDYKIKLINYEIKSDTESLRTSMLFIVIKLSNSDYGQIIYTKKNEEITKSEVENLFENFRITKSAEYRIGYVDSNELVINLEKTPPNDLTYRASFRLDSNQYDEKEDKNNSKDHTKIININSGEEIEAFLFYSSNKVKYDVLSAVMLELKYGVNYKYDIDTFTDKILFSNMVHEAVTDDKIIDVFPIDNEGCFVIIYPKDYTFISDFSNIITEVTKK